VTSEVLPDTVVVRTEVTSVVDGTVIKAAVEEDVTVRTDLNNEVVKVETLTTLVDAPGGRSVSAVVLSMLLYFFLTVVGIALVRVVSEPS